VDKLLLVIAMMTGFLAGPTVAGEAERIQFAKGSINHTWRGTIWHGEKRFKLWMKTGQQLRVGGPDIYTWHVVTNKGEVLGCNNNSYCSAQDELWSLPYSGDRTIVTDYRMASCAAPCPVSESRRVTVPFEVYK
jgi:hypothetical protein